MGQDADFVKSATTMAGKRKADRVRAVVVDDTAFMRKALVEILSRDGRIEVVGIARHGRELLEIMDVSSPDVITLDVDMPVMDGLTALKHIMIRNPMPVVMISGLADRPDVTFEALRLGAVDFFPKPSGTISLNIHESGSELARLIWQAAFINPYAIKRGGIPKNRLAKSSSKTKGLTGVISVQAPPGTTGHLIRLLANLKHDNDFAVLVVQGFSDDVLSSYSMKMNEILPWNVSSLVNTAKLLPGNCVMTSPYTMARAELNSQHLELVSDETAEPCGLINDLACQMNGHLAHVILGGADSSGLDRINQIKEEGGTVIALSSDKCVYSSLSDAAISDGVADTAWSEEELWRMLNDFTESHNRKNG